MYQSGEGKPFGTGLTNEFAAFSRQQTLIFHSKVQFIPPFLPAN